VSYIRGFVALCRARNELLCMQAEERELNKAHRETSAKVHAALLDSIDVSTAMNALLELVSKANIYIKAREQQYAATPRGAS
jgi:cysteinyl-tRNA synthetase